MQHVLPSVRGLRTLYALSADRIWFALAVVACLLIASEIADRVVLNSAPIFEGTTAL